MSETITLAGGCFWCTESVFIRIPGVLKSLSGYANGTKDHPTYQEVCTGATGHSEVVQITFDPAVASLDSLLDLFFQAHDPTTLNRQGNDVGTQYRSGIYWTNEAQHQAAEAAKTRAQKKFSAPVVTEVKALTAFWPAEDYHQDYFNKNPNQAYCRAVIPPKLKKLGLSLAGL
jgi:peptide-methionine (S)-S-oxide reductase